LDDESSADEHDTWEKVAVNWTCVPFARLDIVPTREEFLGTSGKFCMGVLMFSEEHFLLLQPSIWFSGSFSRIGIASASWVCNKRFSRDYIERNTREIVIT
jgi:hypothetical protein